MSKNRLPFTSLFFLITLATFSQEALIQNVYNRPSTSLNGQWKYIVDPYENGFYDYRYQPFENRDDPGNGAFFTNAKMKSISDLIEYDFDKSDSIAVPSDWNTQKENLFYYEGSVWYKKSFDYSKSAETNKVFAYFEAANYQTDVYLNGKKLGVHVGGFTPFNFEITQLLKEQGNFLILKIDNKRKKEGVPTLNTDWWNYGGPTRGIKLVETPATFIQDYFVHLNVDNPKNITGYIKLNGERQDGRVVTMLIPELGIKSKMITNKNGRTEFDIPSKKLTRWSTSNPKHYKVTIKAGEDEVTDLIGFRTITTKGTEILLNGKPTFLRGISIHEESPTNPGRGNSKADALNLLHYALDLGCNYVRLAHYPHNEHMVRMADSLGILVWEENPVYWTIEWDNEQTLANAKNQLNEVISRDKNRASVIIWSMANETPTSDSRNKFLSDLAKHARAMDPTRLISAALEQRGLEGNSNIRTIDDPFAEVVDVLSFNQYVGWYDGLPEKCAKITWEINQNKPIIISEFGAGAKYGNHGDVGQRWTEEFQEELYLETIKMVQKIDGLSGISPWVLVDFRSPRRVLPEIQDGWNRKGLISEKGEKKKAFYILKEFYEHTARE
jgi:beta-glucuronidase